ncbi:MAG: hypothetical protein AMJ54_13460 [Deltaproteobacteria bacterium SG8_13]|nr:MAG: hypothetical protein AMJ54_13460 [Deltaproteobacteria bacterium SG8_13]
MLTLPSEFRFPGIGPRTTFIVGGSVRDLLLGRPALDTDIAVTGDPQVFARQLARRLSGSRVEIGKSALTIHRVVVGSRIFDVSAIHGDGIEEDLHRRDFTVNALAVDAATGEIIDCTGGRRDLQAGIIRMVSPAVFAADPVRLIRAYRMAAGLQFEIDPATRQAITGNARLVRRSAGERTWSELHKILSVPASLKTLEQMQADGLLPAIFPELAPLPHCFQGGHHRWDVFTHSLQAYRHLESMLSDTAAWLPEGFASPLWGPDDIPAPILKLAILLHDVGKPQSRQEDESGNVHFYGHGKKSADIVAGTTSRLKMSKRDSGYIDFIIRSHIRPLHLFIAHGNGRLTGRGKTRFFTRCGPQTPDLLLHCMADILGKGTGDDRNRRFVDFARQLLQAYLAEYLPRRSRRPLLNGRDLMEAFGLPPSPLLGRLLRQVEEARLAGDIRTRAQALKLAENLVEMARQKTGQDPQISGSE